jgi:hypothetical protein
MLEKAQLLLNLYNRVLWNRRSGMYVLKGLHLVVGFCVYEKVTIERKTELVTRKYAV